MIVLNRTFAAYWKLATGKYPLTSIKFRGSRMYADKFWSSSLVLIVVLLTLVACGGDENTGSMEIAFTPLEGNLYGDWPVREYTARTDQEWTDVWALHDPLQTPPPARPHVDFTMHMLVGASLGWGPNGCDRLRITRVLRESNALRVEYRQFQPDPGAPVACPTVFVPLVDFVLLPQSDQPVHFVQTSG